ADIACWPWFGNLLLYNQYSAAEFLQVESYLNVMRWAKEIQGRPAVLRGRKVNRIVGSEEDQLHERHDARDFDTKTQDKLTPKEL
ncbi:MAG: glutathione-dependent disulfide-bond oxidoreductase, partial [Burkholderiaceae bacterium]|nr:glutathione-dependent disulfide-bond oxidoreductase [Burkholderiaceae bacterium]